MGLGLGMDKDKDVNRNWNAGEGVNAAGGGESCIVGTSGEPGATSAGPPGSTPTPKPKPPTPTHSTSPAQPTPTPTSTGPPPSSPLSVPLPSIDPPPTPTSTHTSRARIPSHDQPKAHWLMLAESQRRPGEQPRPTHGNAGDENDRQSRPPGSSSKEDVIADAKRDYDASFGSVPHHPRLRIMIPGSDNMPVLAIPTPTSSSHTTPNPSTLLTPQSFSTHQPPPLHPTTQNQEPITLPPPPQQQQLRWMQEQGNSRAREYTHVKRAHTMRVANKTPTTASGPQSQSMPILKPTHPPNAPNPNTTSTNQPRPSLAISQGTDLLLSLVEHEKAALTRAYRAALQYLEREGMERRQRVSVLEERLEQYEMGMKEREREREREREEARKERQRLRAENRSLREAIARAGLVCPDPIADPKLMFAPHTAQIADNFMRAVRAQESALHAAHLGSSSAPLPQTPITEPAEFFGILEEVMLRRKRVAEEVRARVEGKEKV